jgi:adenylate cyclase
MALVNANRRAEAVAAFEQALALDPNSYDGNYFYAKFCLTEGDFERSARHFVRALEVRPDDFSAPLMLQQVLVSLKRNEEGVRYAQLGVKRAEEFLRLHPESSIPAQMGAVALAALGERDRAKEWIALALAIEPDDSNAQYNAACTYAQLGEIERAIDVLDVWLPQVKSDAKLWFMNDSDLDPIRSHPRYAKLLELAG